MATTFCMSCRMSAGRLVRASLCLLPVSLKAHVLWLRGANIVTAFVVQDDEGAIKQSEQGIWDPFSVEDLLHKGVASQLEALQTISVNASKEYGLEKALDKMHADWDGLEFKIIEYKDTGTYIVGGTDDIQVSLLCMHSLFLNLQQGAGI